MVETVLVFGVIPAGIYGGIAVATLGTRSRQAPRYRPGRPWDYEPVWWTANPEGADLPELPDTSGAGSGARTARGGARGSW